MNGEPSTFWEHVYHLRERGRIGRVWKPAQIGEHLEGIFAPNNISVNPYNSSISMTEGKIGDYVKKRGEPKALRVGRGKFELIEDPDYDTETRAKRMRLANARAEELRETKKPAATKHSPIASASQSSSVAQSRLEPDFINLPTPIPITLTETERQDMAGLSAEQKAMAILHNYLIDKYGRFTDIEENRESDALSVSIDGVTVMIGAKRVTLNDDRYPMRGMPYRYDRPHDPVALEDWEIVK